MNHSIIIEELESVDQDCFNDTNLPSGVSDVTTRIGAHESWSIALVSITGETVELKVLAYPKQIAMFPAFIRFCR